MNFENKLVVITGGAHGIGLCAANEFKKLGAHVCVIDVTSGDHYIGDIGKKEVLEDFARTVIEKFGHVDVLVNNAPPQMIGINECTWEEFQNALNVGVTAPFYLCKLFSPYFYILSNQVPYPCRTAAQQQSANVQAGHKADNKVQGMVICVPQPHLPNANYHHDG
jgi:NAD(P)-dependent dehydrogenase (short-subunit alcohol dehydrogenase family)